MEPDKNNGQEETEIMGACGREANGKDETSLRLEQLADALRLDEVARLDSRALLLVQLGPLGLQQQQQQQRAVARSEDTSIIFAVTAAKQAVRTCAPTPSLARTECPVQA